MKTTEKNTNNSTNNSTPKNYQDSSWKMKPEVIGYDDIGACTRLRLHYSMETMT